MKFTIIYDNTVYKKDLQADWGFSCLIEIENMPRMLFDTGASGSILLSNMEKLGINPDSIGEVFISHAHFDHTGGLSHFLEQNNNVTIYTPTSFRGIRNVKKIVHVSETLMLHKNVFSTGELDHIEQSMAIRTDKGIILVVGCSHPGMKLILEVARQFGKPYGIIGGLHGFNEFELFNDFKFICPTHCTEHIAELNTRFSKKYLKGGAGRMIEI